MTKLINHHSLIIVIVMLALAHWGLIACTKKTPKLPIEKRKVEIVATTGMVTDMVKAIGKDRIVIKGLMGPGVDPHLYRASAGDVQKLENADLIFYNGLQLEAKLGELFEKMGPKAVAIASQIPEKDLLQSDNFQGHPDPHIWFDVTLWLKCVPVVEAALRELDPQSALYYRENAKAYIEKLQALHKQVMTITDTLPQKDRVLVTAHDAFGYFGKAYGFEVIGLQGISTESEAGTKDVQDLANLIVNRKIKAIFVETSIPKRTLQAVQESAKAKGWPLKIGGELFSDAMGNPDTEEGTYIGMVLHNIQTIVSGLKPNDL